MKKLVLVSLALLASVPSATPARAELLGLFAGRGGDPAPLTKLSAEIGYIAIEGGQQLGLRVNYRFDERVTLYADIGSVSLDEELGSSELELDGQPVGAGVFYHLPDVAESVEVSLRASYHTAGIDGDFPDGLSFRGTPIVSGKGELDLSETSASVVIGGKEPIAENGLRWFATLGYHTSKGESSFRGTLQGGDTLNIEVPDEDASGVGYSAGLVLPLEAGQAWAGYEVIDGDGGFGAGFRYFFGT